MATSRKKAASGGTQGKKQGGKAAPPWERGNPKADGEHEKLSPQAKAAAKRRAKAAGRPYPNLVDNMRAASGSKK